MFDINVLVGLFGRPDTDASVVEVLALQNDAPVLAACRAWGTLFHRHFFLRRRQGRLQRYKGALPEGLLMTDARDDILGKAGSPSFQRLRDDQTALGERWDRVAYSFSVTYRRGDLMPTVVSLFRKYEI
ncbi:hypothetical protein ACEN9F_00930 [Duganella sp. CT11-25]|uniref:hypothetical protein n=1 Tax=unclassified Duganella TaxID=2636909 RepID=UPI0039AF478E